MTAIEIVDLGTLMKGGRIRNLSGRERGIAARKELKIDDLDSLPTTVEIVIPDHVDAISPSYFQGLFSQSVARFHGREGFLKKYRFKASDNAMEWIDIGIRNATSRAPLI